MQSALLTVSHVARLLCISEPTARRLDPILKPVRDSANRRLYDRGAVERYAAKRAAK
jgi:hypothetical protein